MNTPNARERIAELLKLGHIGLELGYWDQATLYFDQVLALDPDHPEALLGKARSCMDPHESLKLVEQVLAQLPNDPEALQLQSELLQRTQSAQYQYHPAPRPSLPEKPSPEQVPVPETAPPEAPAEEADLAILQAELERIRMQAPSPSPYRTYFLYAALILLLLLAGLAASLSYVARRRLEAQTTISLLPSPTMPAQPVSIEDAQRAIVALVVPNQDLTTVQRGSGVVVVSDGLILTNYHLLTDEHGLFLNPDALALVGTTDDIRNPPTDWYIAALVKAAPNLDLAALRILSRATGEPFRGRLPEIREGSAESLQLGDTLFGLGYPALGGNTLTLTRGSMAGFIRSPEGIELGKTDSELLPGSSGGAVVNERAELVGIITAANSDLRTQGRLSYFVLISDAHELIQQAKDMPTPRIDVTWLIESLTRL